MMTNSSCRRSVEAVVDVYPIEFNAIFASSRPLVLLCCMHLLLTLHQTTFIPLVPLLLKSPQGLTFNGSFLVAFSTRAIEDEARHCATTRQYHHPKANYNSIILDEIPIVGKFVTKFV